MAEVTDINGNDAHKLLKQVVGNDEKGCSVKMYNNWAQNYENDMAQVQYFGPKTLMEHFDKLNVAKDAKILDICAGTGGIGRELVKRGYSDLHAIDGSDSMLAKAKEEGNYKTYTQLMFEPESKLPYDDATFDCVLLAGVFAPGHLPIVALREACRVTRVGGVICWICCDPDHYEDMDSQYKDKGFYKLLDSLANEGKWKKRDGFPVPVPYIEYSDGFIMAYDVIG